MFPTFLMNSQTKIIEAQKTQVLVHGIDLCSPASFSVIPGRIYKGFATGTGAVAACFPSEGSKSSCQIYTTISRA
jgi:hypothetical protein